MAQVNTNFYDTTGVPLSEGACVVIVKTEWNAAIVGLLESGCIDTLAQYKATVKVLTVPGAVEIPFAVRQYWQTHQQGASRPDAFITLGCVLRGDTPHFEYVCQSVTQGVTALNLELPVPVIFGVLTVNTQEQADERTGGIHGHKGSEAAITALKMIHLQQSFTKKEGSSL
jgi:6,7-dimethyl-8-ribityllumazine synthase